MKKTTEDYLKTVYQLNLLRGRVRCVDLAREIGVSKPTVSNTVKRLKRDGYITAGENRCIELTEAGLAVAKATLERNMTIRSLLVALGVEDGTAKTDACEMEHAISAQSLSALKALAESGRVFAYDNKQTEPE